MCVALAFALCVASRVTKSELDTPTRVYAKRKSKKKEFIED